MAEMRIKLQPLSTRAKNRVREHGDTFTVKSWAVFEAVFVACECTRHSHDPWFGWFDRAEVKWTEISDNAD